MHAVADEIRADIPCRHCGYNLRGLNLAGRCPECGRSVRASARRGKLRYAPTRWLRRVMLGGYLLVCGAVLTPFALLVALNTADRTAALSAALPLALVFLGVWLATTREGHEHGARARLQSGLARSAAAVPLSVFALFVYASRLPGLAGELCLAAAALAGLSSLWCWPVYWARVIELLRRLPDKRLVRSLRAAQAAQLLAAVNFSGGLLLLLLARAAPTWLEASARAGGGTLVGLGAMAGVATLGLLVVCLYAQLMLSHHIYRVLRARRPGRVRVWS